MPIDGRIEVFSFFVGILANFAVPMSDPRGMETLQRLQPPKARLEEVVRIVRKICLWKRKMAAQTPFTRILVQFFNEDIADWARAVMSTSIRNFPTPQKVGQAAKGGNDDYRRGQSLVSRANYVGTLSLEWADVGKELRVAVRGYAHFTQKINVRVGATH